MLRRDQIKDICLESEYFPRPDQEGFFKLLDTDPFLPSPEYQRELESCKSRFKLMGRAGLGALLVLVTMYPRVPILRRFNQVWQRLTISGSLLLGFLLVLPQIRTKMLAQLDDRFYLENKQGYEKYIYEGDPSQFSRFK